MSDIATILSPFNVSAAGNAFGPEADPSHDKSGGLIPAVAKDPADCTDSEVVCSKSQSPWGSFMWNSICCIGLCPSSIYAHLNNRGLTLRNALLPLLLRDRDKAIARGARKSDVRRAKRSLGQSVTVSLRYKAGEIDPYVVPVEAYACGARILEAFGIALLAGWSKFKGHWL